MRRVGQARGAALRAGDFVGLRARRRRAGTRSRNETGVELRGRWRGDATPGAHEVKRLRVGMYQRYRGGNIDEGWTRWLLEQFGFPYTSLMDAELKKGKLNEKYDVDHPAGRFDGDARRASATRRTAAGAAGQRVRQPTSYPPEYRSGFGKEGVDALKAFVEKGGTLVTFGEASNFAIEKLGLAVRNVVAPTASRSSSGARARRSG